MNIIDKKAKEEYHNMKQLSKISFDVDYKKGYEIREKCKQMDKKYIFLKI